MRNDKKSEPSYKSDYEYYIKNPNILADKIVEIYDNNQNASVFNTKNKNKPQNVVNKIDKDEQIAKQHKEFVKEFRNIPNNTKIQHHYETYKNLVLDRINDEEISTSNDDSFIEKWVKNLLKT